MAGNYMDAPAHRVAYDRDGSVGVSITNTGIITAMTATQMQSINSEAEGGLTLPSSAFHLAIIFAVPINISAIFLSMAASTPTPTILTSKDSTNGADGTWLTRVGAASYLRDVKPNYRLSSYLTSIPGGADSQNVTGLRISGSAALAAVRALHVYGSPGTAATPDRLEPWHPTLNEPLGPTYFDWGNTPRSSSADRSFRIKNHSTTLTAEDVELYVEALTPGAPSVSGMHTISENGGSTFLNAITLDELGPGDISDVLILRRVVPNNAAVSVWSARLGVDVGSWI